jgi:heme exporter protein B
VNAAGVGFARATWIVFRTDLRLELRARDATTTSLLFGTLVLVVASFALAEAGADPAATGSAAYWIAVGLGANLALVRSWTRERDDAALDGLLLAPIPRAAILAGKALALAGVLAVVEIALALPLLVLFRLRIPAEALWILPAALLATLGIAILGSLFGAAVAGGPVADLLVGIAVYPLLVPLFLGAVEISRAALAGGSWQDVSGWLLVLGTFDVVLGGAALWLFRHVIDE